MDREQSSRPLTDATAGDAAAEAHLWTFVYDEPRRIAHRGLGRERPDGTLGTTALIQLLIGLGRLEMVRGHAAAAEPHLRNAIRMLSGPAVSQWA